ncbi:MAG: hypothetical protein ACO329_08325 [Steroidobacteraceae bacterium]|jgi:hypothetical protein
MSRQPMRRTIRGGRPYFFADPAIDKVLNMVVVLASEVWTLRERLMAMEAIQVTRGGLKAGEIDRFEFKPDDEANLAAQRKEYIDSLFRVLAEQVDEARRSQPAAKPVSKTASKSARKSSPRKKK